MFFFSVLKVKLLTLSVSDACDPVLHLAAKVSHAVGELRGVGRYSSADGSVVIVMTVITVIFTAFSLNVSVAEDFQKVILHLFSFTKGKAVEVILIIIEMLPD